MPIGPLVAAGLVPPARGGLSSTPTAANAKNIRPAWLPAVSTLLAYIPLRRRIKHLLIDAQKLDGPYWPTSTASKHRASSLRRNGRKMCTLLLRTTRRNSLILPILGHSAKHCALAANPHKTR